MASAPKIEALAVVLALSPHDILIGERLGAFCPDKAGALGAVMAKYGQHTPILVRKSGARAKKSWTLVAGELRLVGAIMKHLPIIYAIEVSGDKAELARIEASENVERAERSPLERANFVRAIADAAEARLKGEHDGLTAQQIGIRKRWDDLNSKAPGVERDDTLVEAEADHTSANFARLYGWAEQTAEALGMSRRALYLDLALHRALIAPFPDLWRELATHPIVGGNASQLREIASYAPGARRDIIEGLIQAPEMTLAQALDGLALTTPKAPAATGATKFMNNMASNLRRLSAGDQARIAPEIVATMKPSALLALRAALDARISSEGIEG